MVLAYLKLLFMTELNKLRMPLMILVNPAAGKRKAIQVFFDVCEPILVASFIKYELVGFAAALKYFLFHQKLRTSRTHLALASSLN